MRHLPFIAVALCALHVPTADAARQKRAEVTQEIAPWTVEPDRIKLEIVERLVLEKHQYGAALPLIAAMRQEGLNAPVLDLLQGISLREEGMLTEAEGMLLTARKRSPTDARVHEALCVLYADQHRLDQALAACEKATKVEPERASAWNNLGYLYLVADRPLEAVEACARAVELDSSQARYRNNLAMAHVAAGSTAKALATFRTTHAEPDALYNVGVAVERFVGPEDALSWYRRAIELEPQHPSAVAAIERLTSTENEP